MRVVTSANLLAAAAFLFLSVSLFPEIVLSAGTGGSGGRERTREHKAVDVVANIDGDERGASVAGVSKVEGEEEEPQDDDDEGLVKCLYIFRHILYKEGHVRDPETEPEHMELCELLQDAPSAESEDPEGGEQGLDRERQRAEDIFRRNRKGALLDLEGSVSPEFLHLHADVLRSRKTVLTFPRGSRVSSSRHSQGGDNLVLPPPPRKNPATGREEVANFNPVISSRPPMGPSEREDEDGSGRRRLAVTTGTKTVLAIRVVAGDYSSTSSLATIADKNFGSAGDLWNIRTGFLACSHNQLDLTAYKGTLNGNVITDGTYEVTIPQNVFQVNNKDVEDDVTAQVTTDLGTLSGVIDHVLYVLPPNTAPYFNGTTTWVGYADLDGYLSVYNDEDYRSPTVAMHEIGHNLNLDHSNDVNQVEYGDRTCTMGIGSTTDEGPRKCFNGHKAWELGWYSSNDVELDATTLPEPDTWKGRLIGTANYNVAAPTDTVVLKIITNDADTNEYFALYNNAVGHNVGQDEFLERVVIVRTELTTQQSQRVAGLAEGEKYEIVDFTNTANSQVDTLIVEVTALDPFASPTGYADVSVYRSTASNVPSSSPTTSKPTVSMEPTTSVIPSLAPSFSDQSLSVGASGSIGTNSGIFFDVRAKGPDGITVYDMDVRIDGNADEFGGSAVQVWTKSGTHEGYEDDPSAWTLVYFAGTVTALGSGADSTLPGEFHIPIIIEPNQVQAFLVRCPGFSQYVWSQSGTTAQFQTVKAQDDEMIVYYGTRGQFSEIVDRGASFVGEIYYRTTLTDPTSTPSLSPSVSSRPSTETAMPTTAAPTQSPTGGAKQLLVNTPSISSGSSGIFFDVKSKGPNGVSIFDLDVNLGVSGGAAGTISSVEIWTRSGTHEGFEGSNTGWTQVYSASNVVAASGAFSATSLPGEFTMPVSIEANKERAFFVRTTGGFVWYDTGRTLGNTKVDDTEFAVQYGASGVFGSSLTNGQGFAGNVHYRTVPADITTAPSLSPSVSSRPSTETASPTTSVTLAPTEAPTAQAKQLSVDTPSVNSGFTGVFFDVFAKGPDGVSVFDLDVNLGDATGQATTKSIVEIWTRPGTHEGFEGSNTGWTQVYSATDVVVTSGAGSATSLPLEFTLPVSIEANEERGFFVRTTGGFLFFDDTGGTLGNTQVDDAEIAVQYGVYTSNFGSGLGANAVGFAGNVHYRTVAAESDESASPSSSPSSQPTALPSSNPSSIPSPAVSASPSSSPSSKLSISTAPSSREIPSFQPSEPTIAVDLSDDRQYVSSEEFFAPSSGLYFLFIDPDIGPTSGVWRWNENGGGWSGHSTLTVPMYSTCPERDDGEEETAVVASVKAQKKKCGGSPYQINAGDVTDDCAHQVVLQLDDPSVNPWLREDAYRECTFTTDESEPIVINAHRWHSPDSGSIVGTLVLSLKVVVPAQTEAPSSQPTNLPTLSPTTSPTTFYTENLQLFAGNVRVVSMMDEPWPDGYPKDTSTLMDDQYDTTHYIPNAMPDVDIEVDLSKQRLIRSIEFIVWYQTVVTGSVEVGVAPDDGCQSDCGMPTSGWTWYTGDTISSPYNKARSFNMLNAPARYVWIRLRGASSDHGGSDWGIRRLQITGDVSTSLEAATLSPTAHPSESPSMEPSGHPSEIPSSEPSFIPSSEPSSVHSSQPSNTPSTNPSQYPSPEPSPAPSESPSVQPTPLVDCSSKLSESVCTTDPANGEFCEWQGGACALSRPTCPLLTQAECVSGRNDLLCTWDGSLQACDYRSSTMWETSLEQETKWHGFIEFGQTHVIRASGETRHAPKLLADREAELLFTPTLEVQPTPAPTLPPTEAFVHEYGLEQLGSVEIKTADGSDWPPEYPNALETLIDDEESTTYYIPNSVQDVDIEFDLAGQRRIQGVYINTWFYTEINDSIEVGVAAEDGCYENCTLPTTGWTWYDGGNIPNALNEERIVHVPKVQARYVIIRLRGGFHGSGQSNWGLRRLYISGDADGEAAIDDSTNVETGIVNGLAFIPDASADVRVAAYSVDGALLGVHNARDPSSTRPILDQALTTDSLQPYSLEAWGATLPFDWIREGTQLLIGTTNSTDLLIHRTTLRNLAAWSEHTLIRVKVAIFGTAEEADALDTYTHSAKMLADGMFGIMPVAELKWVDTPVWHLDYLVQGTSNGPQLVRTELERREALAAAGDSLGVPGDEPGWDILKNQLALKHSTANTGRGFSGTALGYGGGSPYASHTSILMGWAQSVEVDDGDNATDNRWAYEDLGQWPNWGAAAWTGWCAMRAGDECSNYLSHEIGHSQTLNHFVEGTAEAWGIADEYPFDGTYTEFHPWGYDTPSRRFRTWYDVTDGSGKRDPMNGGEPQNSETCMTAYTAYHGQRIQNWSKRSPVLLSSATSNVPEDGLYLYSETTRAYERIENGADFDQMNSDMCDNYCMPPLQVAVPVVTLIGTLGRDGEACQTYPANRWSSGNTFQFPDPFTPGLPAERFNGGSYYLEMFFADGSSEKGLIGVPNLSTLNSTDLHIYSLNIAQDRRPTRIELHRFVTESYPFLTANSSAELLHTRHIDLPADVTAKPLEGIAATYRFGRSWMGDNGDIVLDELCISAEDCSSFGGKKLSWRGQGAVLMYGASIQVTGSAVDRTIFDVPVEREEDGSVETVTVVASRFFVEGGQSSALLGASPASAQSVPPDATHGVVFNMPSSLNSHLGNGTYHTLSEFNLWADDSLGRRFSDIRVFVQFEILAPTATVDLSNDVQYVSSETFFAPGAYFLFVDADIGPTSGVWRWNSNGGGWSGSSTLTVTLYSMCPGDGGEETAIVVSVKAQQKKCGGSPYKINAGDVVDECGHQVVLQLDDPSVNPWLLEDAYRECTFMTHERKPIVIKAHRWHGPSSESEIGTLVLALKATVPAAPSVSPSSQPSIIPSSEPTRVHSYQPSTIPSTNPSEHPSHEPSPVPSESPSVSFQPSEPTIAVDLSDDRQYVSSEEFFAPSSGLYFLFLDPDIGPTSGVWRWNENGGGWSGHSTLTVPMYSTCPERDDGEEETAVVASVKAQKKKCGGSPYQINAGDVTDDCAHQVVLQLDDPSVNPWLREDAYRECTFTTDESEPIVINAHRWHSPDSGSIVGTLVLSLKVVVPAQTEAPSSQPTNLPTLSPTTSPTTFYTENLQLFAGNVRVVSMMDEPWPDGYPKDTSTLMDDQYDTTHYIPNAVPDVDIEVDLSKQRLIRSIEFIVWYQTAVTGSIEVGVAPDDGCQSDCGMPTSGWTWYTGDTINSPYNKARSFNMLNAPARYVWIRLRGASSDFGSDWGIRRLQITGDVSTSLETNNSTSPSASPSAVLTQIPSTATSLQPSVLPTSHYSETPSVVASVQPSFLPSKSIEPSFANHPSSLPSKSLSPSGLLSPSSSPSSDPSLSPSSLPSSDPSSRPSQFQSSIPSGAPSVVESSSPSSFPSSRPSSAPSSGPSSDPSLSPSLSPSNDPSLSPSSSPSSDPSSQPSQVPSSIPSGAPSVVESSSPSSFPSSRPSSAQSSGPSSDLSLSPSSSPSSDPSLSPTLSPSSDPSSRPSQVPSSIPSGAPSVVESSSPSSFPSRRPSSAPSSGPSSDPSLSPSSSPSSDPSLSPSSSPSSDPSLSPSSSPSSDLSSRPSQVPSSIPSGAPSVVESSSPSSFPSRRPSSAPSSGPSSDPSLSPSSSPSSDPSLSPSSSPSSDPSLSPSSSPSSDPSLSPSSFPSSDPSSRPSQVPSSIPSGAPSVVESSSPSSFPSSRPSSAPSSGPSSDPSMSPSSSPSSDPSPSPSSSPSSDPSLSPSSSPSSDPSSRPSQVPSSIPSGAPSVVESSSPSSFSSSRPSSAQSSGPSSDLSLSPSSSLSSDPSLSPSSSPSSDPSSRPSQVPSSIPSGAPSVVESSSPSSFPSRRPSSAPSSGPSSDPSLSPSSSPSSDPSLSPSSSPSSDPSLSPSSFPSSDPSSRPSQVPSSIPSGAPSVGESSSPSRFPSRRPSSAPSSGPSSDPSLHPSSLPSGDPSLSPSSSPSSDPYSRPSQAPSSIPSGAPSVVESSSPSSYPSSRPSSAPSSGPSSDPSSAPSVVASTFPSSNPSSAPSVTESAFPSDDPSSAPTVKASAFPSSSPSSAPSMKASASPSVKASASPSSDPSSAPSVTVSASPSSDPSSAPSVKASTSPSSDPSSAPSVKASMPPSSDPSLAPSAKASASPSGDPSSAPSVRATRLPSSDASSYPSMKASTSPSNDPSFAPSVRASASPSGSPSSSPSVMASRPPSSYPSSSPSNDPSSMPSRRASASPTGNPSHHPSLSPSYKASTSPSNSPSSVLSTKPSSMPSSSPPAIQITRFEATSDAIFSLEDVQVARNGERRLSVTGAPVKVQVTGTQAVALDWNCDGYGAGEHGTFDQTFDVVGGNAENTIYVLPPDMARVFSLCATPTAEGDVTPPFLCETYFVVYDPDAGTVKGRGEIESPVGALRVAIADVVPADEVEDASFDFQATYRNRVRYPNSTRGDDSFVFDVGDFGFRSTNYDWLVVSGNRVKFQGEGTVNGMPGYDFLVTATDSDLGTKYDEFRVQIWNSGSVIYDTLVGQEADRCLNDCYDGTEISKGRVQIRAGKGSTSQGTSKGTGKGGNSAVNESAAGKGGKGRVKFLRS